MSQHVRKMRTARPRGVKRHGLGACPTASGEGTRSRSASTADTGGCSAPSIRGLLEDLKIAPGRHNQLVVNHADQAAECVPDNEQVHEPDEATEESDAVSRKVDRKKVQVLADIRTTLEHEHVRGDEETTTKQQSNRDAPRA